MEQRLQGPQWTKNTTFTELVQTVTKQTASTIHIENNKHCKGGRGTIL